MDGVGFIFVSNHDVFVSADRGDWQPTSLVSVDIKCQIDNF